MALIESTQIGVKKLSISSDVYPEGFDLTNLYQEINLYDNMFFPCMTGNVVLGDSVGLVDKLQLNGSEYITMVLYKDEGSLKYEKKYKVYSLTNRKNINQTSQVIVLNFISEEYIISLQKRLNRSYSGMTHTDMAISIMIESLGLTGQKFATPSITKGDKTEIIPNLRPIEAINWIARRSVNKDNIPDFLFYENILGYNFASLSDITSLPSVTLINEMIKNLDDDRYPSYESMSVESSGLRDFEVKSQFNIIDTLSSGVYAGTFLGFDPITRSYVKRELDFVGMYGNKAQPGYHGNPNIPLVKDNKGNYSVLNYDARKVFYPVEYNRSNSQYIKNRIRVNPEDNNIVRYDSENFALQRKSIFKNFLNKRVKGVVPGNFAISSGLNVDIHAQERNSVENVDNRDLTRRGKYTIISTRHIISYNKHETIFEAVTDSYSNEVISSSGFGPLGVINEGTFTI